MKLVLIRHGQTIGNLKKRYIGTTDEPLCEEGKTALQTKKFPAADIVIASPMKRCIETAKLIYPDRIPVLYNGLQECDFGDFEGKNYFELNNNADYQKWIESKGTGCFPDGEHPEHFKHRCLCAFEECVNTYSFAESIAFVVHGGTIMSILEKYSRPRKSYYDFQIENGCGYVGIFDGESIRIAEEI